MVWGMRVSVGHSEPMGMEDQNVENKGSGHIIPVDDLDFNIPEVVNDSVDPCALEGPTPAIDIAPGALAPVENLVNAPEVPTSAEFEIGPEG